MTIALPLISDLAILFFSFVQALPYIPYEQILSGFVGILAGLVLLVIGVLIIVLLVGTLLVFLPAIIVAIIVWFLSGSLFYAGIAFLIVAVISLVAR